MRILNILLLSIQISPSHNLNRVTVDPFLGAGVARGVTGLKEELILRKRLNNELRRIRLQIDEKKDQVKKAKMLRAYRKMYETLI